MVRWIQIISFVHIYFDIYFAWIVSFVLVKRFAWFKKTDLFDKSISPWSWRASTSPSLSPFRSTLTGPWNKNTITVSQMEFHTQRIMYYCCFTMLKRDKHYSYNFNQKQTYRYSFERQIADNVIKNLSSLFVVAKIFQLFRRIWNYNKIMVWATQTL